jgi:hypothetical protein
VLTGLSGLSGLSAVAGGKTVAYLLRDEFNTDQAAPLPSSRACEPGPGTLTIADAGNRLSVAGGTLQYATHATVAAASAMSPAVTHAAGRAVLMLATPVTQAGSNAIYGWSPNTNSRLGFTSANYVVVRATFVGVGSDALALNTANNLAVVRRAGGGAWYVKGGRLVWVDAVVDTTSLSAGVNVSGLSESGSVDSLRVTDLDPPWDTDYGISTQRLAGGVAAGTAFAHTPDCLVEFTLTTRPTAGSTLVRFRKQDATNYWECEVNAAGDIRLNEVVAGANTNRAVTTAVVLAGHRVVVIVDAGVIRGYSNNVLRWTYSSAVNFQAATAGELNALGTGGVVSDLIGWPRAVTLPAV